MKHAYRKSIVLSAGLVAMLSLAGCHKKVKAPEAPAPPAASVPAPTASITANPQSVTPGSPVVLTWQTTNATNVSIDGIGEVPTAGTKTVTPNQTTTYQLVATGQGGSTDASVEVTVASASNNIGQSNITEAEFEANVKPVFYGFDSYQVNADGQSVIQQDANYLNQHPSLNVVIGGYCDDRGSIEYNLALGENRANAAKQALVSAGVSPDRLRTVSYGKEKQFCSEQTDSCWQLNRRAQFTLDQ